MADFAAEIERFGNFTLDYVLYITIRANQGDGLINMPKRVSTGVTCNQQRLDEAHYKAIGGDLFLMNGLRPQRATRLRQSCTLIRHNANAVAQALMKIYSEK